MRLFTALMLLAQTALGINITNYPVVTSVSPGQLILLSDIGAKTNYNIAYADFFTQVSHDTTNGWPWTVLSGSATATNLAPNLLATNLTLVSNSVVLVHNGTYTPCQTVNLAASRAVAGDSIVLSPGWFYVSNWFKVPTNGSLVGSGRTTVLVNCMTNTGRPYTLVNPSDGCYVADLTITNFIDVAALLAASLPWPATIYGGCIGVHLAGDPNQTHYSHCTFQNLWLYGLSDCLYNRGNVGPVSVDNTWINCRFDAPWDSATYFMHDGYQADFHGCTFTNWGAIGDGGGGCDCFVVSSGQGSFNFYGCTFDTTNIAPGAQTASYLYNDTEGKSVATFHDCVFRAHGAGVIAFVQAEAGSMEFDRCSLSPSVIGNGDELTGVVKTPVISDELILGGDSGYIAPSITGGTDAPTASKPAGSLYLRNTGQLYLRTNGTWIAQTEFGGNLGSNGSGLTNLNAGNLASGTVPEARSQHTLTNLTVWGPFYVHGDSNGTNAFYYDAGGLWLSNAAGILRFKGGSGLELTNYIYGGVANYSNGVWNLGTTSSVANITLNGVSGNVTVTGAVSAASFAGDGSGLTMSNTVLSGQPSLPQFHQGMYSSATGAFLGIDSNGNLVQNTFGWGSAGLGYVGAISGDGRSLNNLNAGNLASGTVLSDRLPNPLMWNTNTQAATEWMIWSNITMQTALKWVPGVGLVFTNSTTRHGDLIVGTNGGINLTAYTPAGPGNLVVSNLTVINGVTNILGTNYVKKLLVNGATGATTYAINVTGDVGISGNSWMNSIYSGGMLTIGDGGSGRCVFDSTALYPQPTYDIGKIGAPMRSVYVSNIFASSITATNGFAQYAVNNFITNSWVTNSVFSMPVPLTVSGAATTNYLQYNYTNIGLIYVYCHTNTPGTTSNSWLYFYLKPTMTGATYP